MNAFKFLNNTTAIEQHIFCFLNLSVKSGFTPLVKVQWECSEGKIKVIYKVLNSSYKKPPIRYK